jgi:DNA-binding NarL/FixJ family response regulator
VIRILVVDDHPIVQDGLCALIDTVEGMTVVSRAGSGREAVSEAIAYDPDVVLMDLQMPGGSGIEATREIVGRCRARVLVLTLSDDDDSIHDAIRAGARGYLLKGARQEEVIAAIDAVASGGALFSSAVADRVLGAIEQRPAVAADPLPDLTPRERDILDLLADGSRNSVIAQRLGVSVKTVANNLSVIFTKLGVEDRSQAIIVARQAGLGSNA